MSKIVLSSTEFRLLADCF